LLIEPTETEAKEDLDRFVEVLTVIKQEAVHEPIRVKQAPHNLAVKRLDDVRAARDLDLSYVK
jgi:glycine dehydrogenase subunit 2